MRTNVITRPSPWFGPFLIGLVVLLALGMRPAAVWAANSFSNASAGFTGVEDSAAAWGDYDSDGDLDVVIAGLNGSTRSVKLYTNTSGSFADSGTSFTGVEDAVLAWGDYDSDGDLDLLLAGYTGTTRITTLYKNTSGSFADSGASFTGISNGGASWGDYDRDGDLDLALAGITSSSRITTIYKNTNGSFADSGVTLTAQGLGDLEWGDYDGDGDLDLVVTGGTGSTTSSNTTKLYQNTNGSLSEVTTSLAGTNNSDLAWGDYDADGDLDLVISGQDTSGSQITKIYTNSGGTLSDSGITTQNVESSAVAWGDYDNDGDLDLALTGRNDSFTTYARIYTYGSGTFTNSGFSLTGLYNGGADWADYDGDGDLDLLITGHASTGAAQSILYANSGGTANTSPNAPTGLSASVSGTSVTLSWGTATDTQTASAGLSYTIRVGTSSGGVDVVTPHANASTGWRRLVGRGNAQQETSATLSNLKPGYTYYWSVQSIDGASAGSAWATQGTFSISQFTEHTALAGVGESAAAWGDYDSDGDLDVVVAGDTGSNNRSTKLYKNTSGSFADSGVSLTGVDIGNLEWADYDEDGDLDLLVIGEASTGRVATLYKNTSGSFADSGVSLTGVKDADAAWGDYDNDGDLDLLLAGDSSGGYVTKLYQNSNGSFSEVSTVLPALSYAAAAWGDYDGDGDLDLAINGFTGSARVSRIYRNTNGSFADISAGLTGSAQGDLAWGDYDEDGDLDLAINGWTGSTYSSVIYRNDGGSFVNIAASLTTMNRGGTEWGDVDNDGDLDLLLTGTSGGGNRAQLYRNDSGTFTLAISGMSTGVYDSDAVWGDYDGDGDLDALITGYTSGSPITKIYRNDTLSANTTPNTPSNLSASISGDDVTLSWDAVTDTETLSTGLSYNLRIGTSAGSANHMAPHADTSSGWRRVVALGNVQNNTSWTLDLTPGTTYYWSVQAVDSAFAGSGWATEGSFTAPYFTDAEADLLDLSDATSAWGDYDGDGDLDLFISGLNASATREARLYQNTNGMLTNSGTSLTGVTLGSSAWGDYDNDGDVDLVVAGYTGTLRATTLYQNTAGSLSAVSAGFTGISDGDLAWGDADNDGDLDLALTGYTGSARITRIYTNTDGSFAVSSASLTGVMASALAWADYDSDGDLDLLVSGSTSTNVRDTTLYKNTGGSFADSGVSLTDMRNGDVAWGDFEEDGDIDLAISGNTSNSTNENSTIYRNNGTGTFTSTSNAVTGVSSSSLMWGDFNNDGDHELLAAGRNTFSSLTVTKLYHYSSGALADLKAELTGVYSATVSWADYDDDGDLDALVAGYTGSAPLTTLYRNNEDDANTAPTAPLSPTATVTGTSATLSWGAATDTENLSTTLTYNLRVGTTPGGSDIVGPNTASDGTRLIVGRGNAEYETSWALSGLEYGATYYWSVQAIDAAYAGSAWATEGSFTIPQFENSGLALTGVANSDQAWGDYDNDGDLDLVISGSNASSTPTTTLYRNDSGSFVAVNAGLDGVSSGGVAWGDYDNDGDLDLVITGRNGSSVEKTILYTNNAGSFVDASAGLAGLNNSAVAWGDYDNDGDLDLLTASQSASYLYRNDGGSFVDTNTDLVDVYRPGLAWGDYDNDGDLDLLIVGDTASTSTATLYNNAGGTLRAVTTTLTGVGYASAAWGDYDSDGDLDLVIAGMASSNNAYSTTIYRNTGGSFSAVSAGLTGLSSGEVAWGDYDNDGDLDLLVNGAVGSTFKTIIYRNDAGTFVDASAGLTGAATGAADWGDYDNDGDLDLVVSGLTSSTRSATIYRNLESDSNSAPAAPSGLSASTSGTGATLSWGAASDTESVSKTLTYNLRVGTTPGGSDVLAPMADSDGWREIVALGSVGHRTSWTFSDLPGNTTYYWSVQAIDTAFAGSDWAAEGSFTTPRFQALDADLPTMNNASVEWGDYDEDGDLDLLMMGENAEIYRNDGTTFTDTNTGLPTWSTSTSAWGDYDNDGDLDLAMTGWKFEGMSFNIYTRIYRNTNGSFADISASLNTVFGGDLAWGDYDNDGDLDLVVAGANLASVSTTLYRNDAGTFSNANASITGMVNGEVAWGDYDGDSDLDLVVTGQTTGGSYVTTLHRNDAGVFSDVSAGFTGLINSGLAWGDYDSDSDLDLALMGEQAQGAGAITRIYRNSNGSFADISAGLFGVYAGDIDWGDYDNDGDLDLVGSGKSGSSVYTTLYRNDAGSFVDAAGGLTGVWVGSAQWGDYDNDGDLDLALNGNTATDSIATLYRNDGGAANTLPSAPTGLNTTNVSSEKATLSWSAASDTQSVSQTLTYNLRIGTTPDGSDVLAPMADTDDGWRRIVELGNVGHETSWTISGLEPATTYYWSVQAIDTAFAGSDWATEGSFTTSQFSDTGAVLLGTMYGDLVWGDYDNDGDLDLLITGGTTGNVEATTLYRNASGSFVDAGANLQNLDDASAAFGDYDNDGDLDLIMAGEANSASVTRLYRNDGGSFVEAETGLSSVSSGLVDWVDYDNDGDLDLLISGYKSSTTAFIAEIYRNDAGAFTAVNAGIDGFWFGDADWADYDLDGDLDLAVSAYDGSTTRKGILYRNDGGSFSVANAGLSATSAGDVSWGDYDSDGDPDLLIIGAPTTGQPITTLYRNDGGSLTEVDSNLPDAWLGDVAWGDYDNDGDLDLVLSGILAQGGTESAIYRNDQGSFVKQTMGLAGRNSTASAWGDYDSDGDLDLAITGYRQNQTARSAALYENLGSVANTPPSAPGGLNAVRSGSEVALSWNAASDTQSVSKTLTYNLRIGTTPGGSDVMAPHTSDAGLRHIVHYGNAGQNTSWTLTGLENTTYYWSVQAIDTAFTGSAWAAEGSFTIRQFSDSGVSLVGAGQGEALWGDYDGDGDLDLLISGSTSNAATTTTLYRNDNGSFVNANAGLINLKEASTAWGDYDNDGDLDLVTSGLSGTTTLLKLYTNTAGTLVDTNANLPNAGRGSVAWGDYDNDGDLDLLITGLISSNSTIISSIYRNDNGSFTDINAGLTGLSVGAGAWVDYDVDGDLDVSISGLNNNGNTTLLYRNDGGSFTLTDQNLAGVYYSDLAWGDYDNDGDPDLIVTGQINNMTASTTLYRNDQGDLVASTTGLPNRAYGDVSWGDADNDGDLDLLLTGITDDDESFESTLYRNDQGSFVALDMGFPQSFYTSAAWGDYDGDDDLDLVISGYDVDASAYATTLYENTAAANTPPSAPSGLSAAFFSDAVRLSWAAASDTQTVSATLTYNLRIGTAPGGSNVLAPHAASDGWRRVVEHGNIGHTTSWDISGLDVGTTYYWSVQAIDAAFAGSGWAAEGSFTVPAFAATEDTLPGVTDGNLVWGDYDSDGDLDLLTIGYDSSNTSITELYRNDNGSFVDANAGMTNLGDASAAFGDYDGDGDLDLVISGLDSTESRTILYQNNAGSFVDVGANLPGVNAGFLAWGDYDNDGDLDLLIGGDQSAGDIALTSLYRNDAGVFNNSGVNLTRLWLGSAAWADFDLDGDLDLATSGYDTSDIIHTILYRNEGGTLTATGWQLNGSVLGDLAWGDYDNDGDPDLVVTGQKHGGTTHTTLYRNDRTSLVAVTTGMPGTHLGSVDWGDYDNDGDLDLLLTGQTAQQTDEALLYRNDQGSFVLQDMGFFDSYSTAAWGDYDGDNDLDVALSGYSTDQDSRSAGLYVNLGSTANTAPSAPSGLSIASSDEGITFSWAAASDTQTVSATLSYNLRIGTTPGGSDVLAPHASSAGWRRIVEHGNVGQTTRWTIGGLDNGVTYYWSVQAIDAAFAGSGWATEGSFILYELDLERSGTGSGTITSSPSGIDCGTECTTSFIGGTVITLTATPAADSTFAGWSGACSGTATTCTLTMDQSWELDATFTLKTYKLEVLRSGNGSGGISSNPAGIGCGIGGGECVTYFTHGTVVTLTAVANSGTVFTGWGGACSGTGTCTVTMDQARSVTATFTQQASSYTLLVTSTGGKGTVTSNPSGISCPSTCVTTVASGTLVTLTATPNTGATFIGWNGTACVGVTAITCTFTMNQSHQISPYFALNTYALTITKAGAGSGTVTSSPDSIDCGSTCTATLDHGTVVTLTATAAEGSSFAGWSGGAGCSGTATTCVVTMDQARSITATFRTGTATPSYPVYIPLIRRQ